MHPPVIDINHRFEFYYYTITEEDYAAAHQE